MQDGDRQDYFLADNKWESRRELKYEEYNRWYGRSYRPWEDDAYKGSDGEEYRPVGKKPLFLDDRKFCYHIKGELPLEKVNKVQNLIWLCNDCYRMVNNGPIPPEIDEKVLKKIQKYKNM